MTNAAEILIPIVMFVSIFGILYVYFITRNKERMAMIEKGADPALFNNASKRKGTSLKSGMFLVGVALGILSGYILHNYAGMDEEVSFFSMVFLFAGLSLIVHHKMEGKASDAN